MSSKRTRKKKQKKAGAKKGPSIGNAIGIVFVVLLVAFALWAQFAPQERATSVRLPAAGGSLTGAPTRTGVPWEYDEPTDHYWDPRPGHQHWHQGQPPPEGQRATIAATPEVTPLETPDGSSFQVTTSDGRPQRVGEPWEYDAEAGFYWDPRPGHEHWHQGEPPPEDQRP